MENKIYLKNWSKEFASMFGRIVKLDFGVFEADIEHTPPIVLTDFYTDSPKAQCFTTLVVAGTNKEIATDKLKKAMLLFASRYKNPENSTLVYREFSVVEYYKHHDPPCWVGRVRLAIIEPEGE